MFDRDIFMSFLITAFSVLAVIALVIFFESVQCHAKADALGYKCKYGPISGCILQKDNGKKVLLEQLRDFDND